MYWKTLLCVILLLCHHPLSSYGYGEPDASGHPSYQERANHVFLNAVRISPSQYKTVYMAGYSPSPASILTASEYPPVPPVYMEPKLVASAYSHSNDMAVHNCFKHDSCDGTPTFTRIQSFYTCNGNMGENIAAGYSDPLATSNQWLCDETGGACAADGSGADGHRDNMMSPTYKAVGVGYDYSASSTYKHYWTQDFGGAPCAPVPTNPIYGGSHRISGSNIKFIAVYYTNPSVAPSSASVVIAGTSYALSVDIGTGGQATYALTQAKGSACRPYYFTIGTSRYPDTGCLVTYGEGTCVTSFEATCGGTTVATSATSSTAATVATSSATSTVATTAAATTAATTSKTTTAAATTAAVTTAAATSSTSTSSTSTTGSGSTYYLYSTSLQNGWVAYGNSGVTIVNPATYQSQTALKVTLTTSTNTMWFQFMHSPAVQKKWTSLRFYAATSANSNIYVFFNGYRTNQKAVTTSWQLFTIPFSSMNPPAMLGDPAGLVFMNGGTSTVTLYLYNVAFL